MRLCNVHCSLLVNCEINNIHTDSHGLPVTLWEFFGILWEFFGILWDSLGFFGSSLGVYGSFRGFFGSLCGGITVSILLDCRPVLCTIIRSSLLQRFLYNHRTSLSHSSLLSVYDALCTAMLSHTPLMVVAR